jgi:putative ABC transport system permease protein
MITLLLAEAWRAMKANRLRTALTMLGMVIGVAAVIAMLALGNGAQQSVERAVRTMGANLFIVLSGSVSAGGARLGGGSAPTLTVDDATAIGELPDIAASAPVHSGNAQVIYGASNWSTSITATNGEYLDARDWNLASGVGFTDSDLRSATRVALLGHTVADNLFGTGDPLGRTIRIQNKPFTVIGVLQAKGQSLSGRDQDDTVLVPLTTGQRQLFGGPFDGRVRMLYVKARSEQSMAAAEREITALLRQRHRLRDDQPDDFFIRNLAAVADSAAETARVMSLLLGGIASISLIVGGIGIMNIMLVSVTERTREIGLRRAIGARQRDIRVQFLLEATLVSFAGCAIGLLIGVGGALLVSELIGAPVLVAGADLLIAVAVSGAIGLIFGYVPAQKAARLDPIEALRQ